MREGMDRNTVWIVLMYVCACLVVPFTTNAVTLMPKGDSYFFKLNVSKYEHLNVLMNNITFSLHHSCTATWFGLV